MKRLVFFLLAAACHTSSAVVATDAPAPAAPRAHTYTKPPAAEIAKKLTPLQYEVTQHDATEPPFRNAYWNEHRAGIYVDVVTGQPLFSSTDKFESGTGWPSFTRPIDDGAVTSKTDSSLGMERTEVRSTSGSSHLGHVFDDGPEPTNLRYCINSAALRFVPVERLDAEGYGAYRARFDGKASEAPAKTENSCAVPPPGQRAGCSTTLETAVLAGDARTAAALEKTPGVLEVDRGTLRGAAALRVVYDPKTLAFSHLLDAWSHAPRATAAPVFAIDGDQKRDAAAWARGKRVAVLAAEESAFTTR